MHDKNLCDWSRPFLIDKEGTSECVIIRNNFFGEEHPNFDMLNDQEHLSLARNT